MHIYTCIYSCIYKYIHIIYAAVKKRLWISVVEGIWEELEQGKKGV